MGLSNKDYHLYKGDCLEVMDELIKKDKERRGIKSWKWLKEHL